MYPSLTILTALATTSDLAMLKAYIDKLKVDTETANRNREFDKTEWTSRSLGVKSLTLQIEELMRSLPPSLRDRVWTMDDFVTRLHGKYRERPHAANVGHALQSLGWIRVRNWSKSGGGRRVWVQAKDKVGPSHDRPGDT